MSPPNDPTPSSESFRGAETPLNCRKGQRKAHRNGRDVCEPKKHKKHGKQQKKKAGKSGGRSDEGHDAQRNVGRAALLVALAASLLALSAASASAASPWWQITTGSHPTNLWIPEGPEGSGRLVVTLTNMGDAPLDATQAAHDHRQTP